MLVICRHRETIGIPGQTQSQFCPGRCPAGQGAPSARRRAKHPCQNVTEI